jgi:hypothetical protein
LLGASGSLSGASGLLSGASGLLSGGAAGGTNCGFGRRRADATLAVVIERECGSIRRELNRKVPIPAIWEACAERAGARRARRANRIALFGEIVLNFARFKS